MASMYKGKIPIIDGDLNAGFVRGTPDIKPSFGAVPRDFSVQPVKMRDSPSAMVLVPESEYDARYDAGEAAEDSLEHIYLRAAEAGRFDFLDQDGFPDCWCHSTAHALMIDRLKQHLPFLKLNAVAVATMIGRTDGGWCGLSMEFAREQGFPVVGDGPGQWPYQSRRGRDTPELRANMKLHRDLKDWYDLSKQVYDQALTAKQLATCLYANNPSPTDYNPFGHSMLALRHVRVERGLHGWLTLNSWQGFGYHGLCVIIGMTPDSSVSLLSSTPSAT